MRGFVFCTLVGAFAIPGWADTAKEPDPNEVIRKFAAKEAAFQKARENYTYRQSVKVQTLDGDTEDGEYQMVYDVTFDNQGRKQQHVVFAPRQMTVTESISGFSPLMRHFRRRRSFRSGECK